MLLSAEHLYKNYGMKQLLQDTSLYLNERERIGIIGLNGSGKSVLLSILAGLETPDEGTITLQKGVQISFLPQNPAMNDEFTVLEQGFSEFPPQFRKIHEYEVVAMLTRLEITEPNAKIGTLSGGQRRRVALAAALTHPSDILILDEPTNHLDNDMVLWLEQWLSRFTGGLIMVTHDRYFLERVTNRITELSNARLYHYEANYSKYIEYKAQREDIADANERKRQTLLRKEQQWMMRGPRARSTKSRDRIERYNALKEQEGPSGSDSITIATLSSRIGKKLIKLDDVSKKYEDLCVLSNFSYNILRDDRIGIVGKNGVGKSTLLNIIAGRVLPDTGTVEIGSTIKIGYLTQESRGLDDTMRVYDFIHEIAGEIQTDEGSFTAAQMLNQFLFPADLQYTEIGKLSGGERRRLFLLSVLMAAPNILLLDEPTNDLDIETLTILEEYLESFPGAVLAVSHDRYFLDKVTSSIFEVVEGGEITAYSGNFSDYLAKRPHPQQDKDRKETASKNRETPESTLESSKPKKLKFTFKEQREFESIDTDIAALEEKIASCAKKMEQASSDYVRLLELGSELETLKSTLETLNERWLYLHELKEQIEKQN